MIRERLVALSRARKRTLQVITDVFLIWLALWVACFVRLGGEGWLWPSGDQWWMFVVAPAVAIPIFIPLGMYRAVLRYFGNEALKCIIKSVTLASISFVVCMALAVQYGWLDMVLSRSVMVLYLFFSLGLLGGVRLVLREYVTGNWFVANSARAQEIARYGETGIPVAIYGAGSAGNQLLASLRVAGVYRPVAFVDDNPELQERIVRGLHVWSPERVGQMISKTGAQEMFLAIPSSTRARRQQILAALQPFPLHVRTMPGMMDLASGRVKIDDMQEVDIADLLGREAVPPDATLFERCIRGQAVMVTGAGGSIGSELCRQIVASEPATLVLFEHSEFALYAIHGELDRWVKQRNLQIRLVPMLGSVRNENRLENVMRAWKVDTVYHAAAYKHVPMVEFNVAEGIMNNVFGTLKVAQAAIRCRVANFVLISTDKAVRPTNVMGSTKRLAEMVLQGLAAEPAPKLWGDRVPINHINSTRFTMVRFGNVLGSSGSVIPLFREQIRRGGPVTVTHPDINRYFMTIPEAAQLVIQAGAMGQGGDVFVLDMGEPVNIADLARKMIMLSGCSVRDEANPNGDIEIAYSGLRPGEKLYEELLIGDNPEHTSHSKIRRANEIYLDWDVMQDVLDTLHAAVRHDDYQTVRSVLLKAVQGYQPTTEIVDLLYDHHVRVRIDAAAV